MKNIVLILLITACGLFHPTEMQAQTNSDAKVPTGIEIVTKLEKPKKADKFDEKNLAGYLLVYFN